MKNFNHNEGPSETGKSAPQLKDSIATTMLDNLRSLYKTNPDDGAMQGFRDDIKALTPALIDKNKAALAKRTRKFIYQRLYNNQDVNNYYGEDADNAYNSAINQHAVDFDDDFKKWFVNSLMNEGDYYHRAYLANKLFELAAAEKVLTEELDTADTIRVAAGGSKLREGIDSENRDLDKQSAEALILELNLPKSRDQILSKEVGKLNNLAKYRADEIPKEGLIITDPKTKERYKLEINRVSHPAPYMMSRYSHVRLEKMTSILLSKLDKDGNVIEYTALRWSPDKDDRDEYVIESVSRPPLGTDDGYDWDDFVDGFVNPLESFEEARKERSKFLAKGKHSFLKFSPTNENNGKMYIAGEKDAEELERVMSFVLNGLEDNHKKYQEDSGKSARALKVAKNAKLKGDTARKRLEKELGLDK